MTTKPFLSRKRKNRDETPSVISTNEEEVSTGSKLLQFLFKSENYDLMDTSHGQALKKLGSLNKNYVKLANKHALNNCTFKADYAMRHFGRTYDVAKIKRASVMIETDDLQHFKALQHLHFTMIFTGFTGEIVLAPTITHVSFYDHYNKSIDGLPPTVVDLTLGTFFNHPVDKLHNGIVSLKLGDKFDQKLDSLPLSIRNLTVGDEFNQTVDLLPPNMQYLRLGRRFNKPIDQLPPALKTLLMRRDFDQSVDHLPSLTRLSLGHAFEQSIAKLPSSITHLNLGEYYNEPTANLPPKVSHVRFGSIFNQPVCHLLEGVQCVSFGFYFDQDLSGLPPSVRCVCFEQDMKSVKSLPASVKHIHVNHQEFRSSYANWLYVRDLYNNGMRVTISNIDDVAYWFFHLDNLVAHTNSDMFPEYRRRHWEDQLRIQSH